MAEPVGAETQPLRNHSYVAMLLSVIFPGLGQLYLGQFLKAFIIFFAFTSALGIVYINSMPVEGWSDLTRFKPPAKTETTDDDTEESERHPAYSIHIWTFDDGEKLMYRPSWKLKVSGSVQGILCWLYAIGDGWWGRRRRSKR